MRVTKSVCALALLAGSLVAVLSVRASAEDAEGKGRVAVLTRQLKSQVHTERIRAANELRELGRDAEIATSALCGALVDRHGSVRQAASEALEEVNPEMRELVLPIMADEHLAVRIEHLNRLESSNEDGKPGIPVVLFRLAESTKSKNFFEAHKCFAALYSIGRNEPEVMEAIITAAAKSKDAGIRGRCLGYMPELGKDVKRIVSVLTAAVRSDQDANKVVAMHALAKFGKAAKPAMEPIRRAKGSGTADVRTAAEEALKAIEAAVESGTN